MRTQATEWFNTEKNIPMYGIKVYHPKHGWVNAAEGNKALLFETKEERDAKRAELRKLKWDKSVDN